MRNVAWVVGLAGLYLLLYFGLLRLEPPKTAVMRLRLDRLKSRVELLTARTGPCEERLRTVEGRSDYVYRPLYGMDPLRRAGEPAAGAEWDPDILSVRLDSLYRRVSLQEMVLDELLKVHAQTGEMQQCLPSIPPIDTSAAYHLSSRFGWRTDPVFGGAEGHSGVDIAMRRGSPVYVTGDGIVEEASFNIGGYGRVVTVNHGFGYKTRYAHLNRMYVHEGQRVKRGTLIGTVGTTGKSTGPHLHYEVRYRGTPVNPMNFMDLQ
ncbi:MAG: M23 family metallopeptidase [Bacteroidales bacterium]|nr:M23 family metallopeptidase [Bacteroidales bacterium]